MPQCSKEAFLKRVETHEMTILRDDGLYRHVRFRAPGTSIDGFDFVTWPGFLCYCGDMGEYVFQRTDDMLAFFCRGDGPNFQYWEEKVVAEDRDGVKEYSETKFRSVIEDWLNDVDADDYLRLAVSDDVLPFADSGEALARKAVDDFNYHGAAIDDFWEYDLTEYTFRFEFCCWALWWGTRKYYERHGE